MNNSSDIPLKFNLPSSYLMNSSLVDETTLNSFLSPRPGSVTVIGKKLHSHSYLSMTESDEKNFPIPVQSLTKINRQKAQAKILLKKKNLKIKVQDQPAPIPKVSKVYPPVPLLKEKKNKARKKVQEKTENKPKQVQAATERPSQRMSKILRQSALFETRKKKREKIIKNLENKKKAHKDHLLKQKNSQIRIENLNRFKREKFMPRAAWGVDERKLAVHERVLRDIDKQREAQKDLKKTRKARKTFFKVLDPDLFKPRSSSNPAYMPKERAKKEPSKNLKIFMKKQRKKERQIENNKIIEDIQKETKRIISLKLLEGQKTQKKEKSRLRFRPKKAGFQEPEDEIAKIYAEKSSEFLFEPDSRLKDQMSEFSEDIEKPKPDQVSAAVKIQYFFRKYLRGRNKQDLFQSNKKQFYITHKSESLPSTTLETAPKQDDMKEEEKFIERTEPEPLRSSSAEKDSNSSLSEVQVSQFESVPPEEASKASISLDPGSQTASKEDFSLSSNDKSFSQETENKENDEVLENEYHKAALVSRSSPVDYKTEESKLITSQDINLISEIVIQQLLIESLNVQPSAKETIAIEKDPISYIDQIIFHTPQKDFKTNIAKPIRKNPLEILAKIQISSDIFVNAFDTFSAPPVIPVSVYTEIESGKTHPVQELRDSQKIHNRLVFDSCNEQLHFFRPYGTQGHPLPWSSSQRSVSKSNSNIFKIIPKIARKIEILSQFGAGKIIDFSSDALQEKGEDFLLSVREEKIGLLILQDIRKDEEYWVDYEYQEVSAIIGIEMCILSELVRETIQII